jgi:hypothetical protein
MNVNARRTPECVLGAHSQNQVTNEVPPFLMRDRDQVYGAVARRRLRAMGIRDKPIAPASP